MREEGVLVAGAQPGRKGAGCFKVSSEEKSRMADAAKAAAKKLKAQQKQGLGKVSWMDIQICLKCASLQVASKAPKKVAKASAGKKVAKGASAGKKMSAKKTALCSWNKKCAERIQQKFPCIVCKKMFSVKMEMKNHVRKVHLAKVVPCGLCAKQVKEIDMSKHTAKYHTE